MEQEGFWSLIDRAAGSSDALTTELAGLPPQQIAAFDTWFWAYYMALRREDLWAAVYAIRGGCSDDSFDYFRGWLIGRGQAAVLAAVRDPESLAELTGDEDPRNEGMLGAARAAYGEDLPTAPDVVIPDRDAWPADRFERGLSWDDDFYAKQFPKLHARYIAPRAVPRAPEALEPGSIPHDRFWSLLADAVAGTSDAAAAETRLAAALCELSREEVVGFERWLRAYLAALFPRDDVRALSRKLLGNDEPPIVAGLRGWLILQCREAMDAFTHRPDELMAHVKHPPEARTPMMLISARALERHGIRGRSFAPETIPDLHTWLPDARDANELMERAKGLDAAARLPLLDRAHALWPANEEVRAMRGRTYHELGNLDAALAELDAVLQSRPDFVRSRWERSKVRFARGDRAGALADARDAAERIDEAKAWLATQASATPRRVRHSKFGEGTVVSADSTGSEPKLVIDFATGRKTLASRFVEVLE
jgi:tetratricopeptide (TPR) repeat protein